jgi:integrase
MDLDLIGVTVSAISVIQPIWSRSLADLEWSQVDFKAAVLHFRRAKNRKPTTHPLRGDEMRALRKLQREQAPASPFIFISERGSPFSTAGFAKMIERAGAEAGLDFKAHPHMLRHACGFTLMVPACVGLQWEYGCASLTDRRGAASVTSFLRNFTGHQGESRVDDHNSDRNINYRTVDISRSAATVALNRSAGADKI